MPIIETFEQRSDEWYAARAGNPGASNVDKIITTSGQRSKQWEDYLLQLAGETITGKCEEGFVSKWMEEGIKREDTARTLFELLVAPVQQVGVVFKDERKLFHCSPDGLVGDDAVLELKNPMMKTHVKYLLAGGIPTEYSTQIQMSLYVTERKKAYFMSHYDGMPPLIVEVGRNETFIGLLAKALEDFSRDLKAIVERLQVLSGKTSGAPCGEQKNCKDCQDYLICGRRT